MSNSDRSNPHVVHGQIVGSNVVKDPEQWSTGDEPMTGAQLSYLKTLSEEAGVELEGGLTKAQASQKISELQEVTGRGKSD